MARKSVRRTSIIKSFAKAIMDPDIYGTLNYERMTENSIKQYMYQYIVREFEKQYCKDKKCKENTAKKKAKECILWEGNKNTTVNNFKLFGGGNRPDFIIDYPGFSIAIEVKKGDSTKTVREGIGQSMTYSAKFDFVICLIVDTSKEKVIVNSLNESSEKKIVSDMWRNNNVWFVVV